MGEGALIRLETRRPIIRRPRLTRLLDETSARIILLVAPAGYGKTMLAREWLATRQHWWYQATAASTDVAALALGIAEAVGFDSEGFDRIRARANREGGEKELARTLLTALDVFSPGMLVVDDYHLLAESRASEHLIAAMGEHADLRLLITSRARPQWASARRILYGEIYEVGQGSLAFDHDECRGVLVHREPSEISGLHALSEGWPAVLGLASVTGDRAIGDETGPSQLYAFFAEELYQSLSPGLRRALGLFVVAPPLSRADAFSLLGPRASALLEEAADAGVLSRTSTTQLAPHPLLRAFLRGRLSEESSRELQETATHVTDWLIDHRRWDDAYEVLQLWPTQQAFERLVENAIDLLLENGRSATLTRWVQNMPAVWRSPLLDLAKAEVAFRCGEHRRAEIHASAAATGFVEGHPRTAHAWQLAGRAADFREDPTAALSFFERARAASTTTSDLREALQGCLSTSLALETDGVEALWELYVGIEPQSSHDELRRATMGLFVASSRGGLRPALAKWSNAHELLADVDDPVDQTGFLNSLSFALILAGQYEEGMQVAAEELAVVAENGLSFAQPHAYLELARGSLGLRRFTDAKRYVDSMLETHDARASPHLVVNSAILRTRIAFQTGEPTHFITPELVELAPNQGLRSEALLTRVLFDISKKNYDSASESLLWVETSSRAAEPVALAALARALLSIARGADEKEEHVSSAFEVVARTGAVDCLVSAYRISPSLLSEALRLEAISHSSLQPIMVGANDVRLARTLYITRGPNESALELLSARERDVLLLIARGLSNDEIASSLYISRATVKAHIRRIFVKLGVKSRTQAALFASQERP